MNIPLVCVEYFARVCHCLDSNLTCVELHLAGQFDWPNFVNDNILTDWCKHESLIIQQWITIV